MKKIIITALICLFFTAPVFAKGNAITRLFSNYPKFKVECLSGLSDKNFDFVFYMNKTDLGIEIKNKSPYNVKVNWDSAAFVNIDGVSHRLIHNNVKLSDKDKQQVPTLLPPNSLIKDNLVPADNIEWNYDHWLYEPLLGKGNWDNAVGKTFTLYLPLEYNGMIYTYNFNFKVNELLN